MKKIFFSVLAGFLTTATGTFADLITIIPSDPTLGNLDHYSAYRWNIDLNRFVPGGVGSLNSAMLTISRITNTMEPERNDILQVSMLDLLTPFRSSSNAVRVFTDYQQPSDFFGVANPLLGWTATTPIGSFSDHNGRYATNNLSFSINTALLRSFAGDNGWIGFGFDPDCHYNNCGVKLTLNVPEPSSASLLYLGFLLLFPATLAVRRKKG